MNTINKRIKTIRRQCKYTQREMAKVFDLTTDAYSKKERYGKFSGEELLFLANYFNIDIRLFFYDDIESSIPVPPEKLYKNCYELNRMEVDILTLYRNLSKHKQKEFFALIVYTFKNRKKRN